MSSHNHATDLERMSFLGGTIFTIRTANPAGGESGYAPGCLWIASNGASSTFWINQGTLASADWAYPTLNS